MVNKTQEEVEDSTKSTAEIQDEYRATFDELWGKSDSGPNLDVAESDDDSAAEEEVKEEATSPTTETTAETTPSESATSTEAEPAKEPERAADNDPLSWIKALPEEVRKQAEALKHSATSHQGRAVAFQKRVSELQSELEQLRATRERDTAAKSGKPTEPAAPELPKEFEKLKEDFPEFAAAVQAVREQDRAAYENRLKEVLSPVEQAAREQKRRDFDDQVTRGAEEIFKTKETGDYWKDIVAGEDFVAWLQLQPQSVRKAATLPDPDEALYVLKRYKQDYDEAVAKMFSETDTGKPTASTSTKADEVQNRRQKRKTEAASQPSKPVAPDVARVGGDYHAEFDRMWGK